MPFSYSELLKINLYFVPTFAAFAPALFAYYCVGIIAKNR